MRVVSRSPEDTRVFARRIARRTASLPPKRARARIMTLSGDLGAGKTTFIQGFAKALGVKAKITSPTFVIMRRYPLAHRSYRNLFHFDAYRMKRFKDLAPLEVGKIFSNPENIVLVEWAENIENPAFRGSSSLRFAHGTQEEERTIVFRAGR